MKKFFHDLFNDDNSINEKSVVGFIAFFMLIVTLTCDIITGFMGKVMPIHEFVFDGFMIITLGAFGIASIDKWINRSKPSDKEEEKTEE